jgi:hypothetical protein
MNVSIAVKQNKRRISQYKEILFLIGIAEYMRKHDPDYNYSELFKKLKDVLK